MHHRPVGSEQAWTVPWRQEAIHWKSRCIPFALTARVQVGRNTRPVSAKRTLSQDSRTNERHRPRGGLKDAQGACRRDRSIKRGRGCIDKQWRSVPFALTAQPKIGRNTHPVSAKGTSVDTGGRWSLSERLETPNRSQRLARGRKKTSRTAGSERSGKREVLNDGVFANHHYAAVRNFKALLIALTVNTDDGAVGDHRVLINNRLAHDRAFTNPHTRQKN